MKMDTSIPQAVPYLSSSCPVHNIIPGLDYMESSSWKNFCSSNFFRVINMSYGYYLEGLTLQNFEVIADNSVRSDKNKQNPKNKQKRAS